jgi:hypothetical protein
VFDVLVANGDAGGGAIDREDLSDETVLAHRRRGPASGQEQCGHQARTEEPHILHST